MRHDKKNPLKPDKKSPSKAPKKVSFGYNKKSALLEDAITQMNAGKYGRASAVLKDLLALDPLNAEGRHLFATLHLRLGSLMSARTAFESLAREAMERQDYWLAESLLREYLTAGPRYVPFLEMLGRVYEDKGDVMAAVAEYGKAVEVLLEDPDTDNPNRASDLFAKIRSIAPGSPVAFRFAALFDTVTGQVLQATPKPAVAESSGESSQSPASSDSPLPSADPAVIMPWEQLETALGEVPFQEETQAAAVAPASETMVPVAPFSFPVEAGEDGLGQAKPEDIPATMLSTGNPVEESKAPKHVDPVEFLATPDLDPIQSEQSEPPNDTLAPDSVEPAERVTSPTAEVGLATSEVAAQSDHDPIAQVRATPLPMPREQVEETATPGAPVSETTDSIATNLVSPPFAEVESPSSAAEPIVSTIELLLPATSSHPITQAPASPAPMPWDQIEEVGTEIPPPESDEPVFAEAPRSEPEVPEAVALLQSREVEILPPVVDTATPTIELLAQASSVPIAKAPTTPAPMPWDQIEEDTNAAVPSAETVLAHGTVEATTASESPAEDQLIEAGAATEPSPSPHSSDITASGLTWDEILAAVTAMQTSPAPAQTLSGKEEPLVADPVVPEPSADLLMAPAEPEETEVSLFEAEVSDHLAHQAGAAPSLSAPMPWEQIEVDDVTILPQEPEPEFGSVSAERVVAVQDSTLLLSEAPQVPETTVSAETRVGETIVDRSVEPIPPIDSELRNLSPDRPITAHEHPIHIPVETYSVAEESTSDAPVEAQPPSNVTIAETVEPPFHLAGDEAVAVTVSAEPALVPTDLVTEFTLTAGTDVTSPAPEPAVVVPAQQLLSSPVTEVGVESPAAAMSSSLIDEKPVEAAQPTAMLSPTVQEVLPAPEPKPASVEQEPAVTAVAGISEVVTTSIADSVVATVETALVSAGTGQKSVSPPPIPEPIVTPVEVPGLTMIEPMQDSVVSAPAVAASIESVAPSGEPAITPTTPSASVSAVDEGLRIIWDDSSSKPTSSVGAGNMLTRWLKKPVEPAPAESHDEHASTTVPAVSSLPVEAQEATVVVTGHSFDPPKSSTPVAATASVVRSKVSQPVTAGVWRRTGEVVASLVGAGVSTTHSLVVMVLALVGVTLALMAGGIGAVALTWLVLDEQPNAAYRSMTSVPQHTLQDSSKNGYVLLLGFGAAASQDPVQAGIDRRVDGADRAVAHTCLSAEEQLSGGEQGASAETIGRWMKMSDPASQMRAEATGIKAWVSRAEVSMGRYQQWLSKPFEDWGYGQSITPNCGLILSAHRLYVAEGFAQDIDTGVTRLETDLTAWRTVLGQAKTLPVKMLASAAMNDDIMVVGGLLVRPELEDRFVSRLAKLSRPLEQAEQSVRWPMQSQFVLATRTLDEALREDRSGTRPFYGAIAAVLPLPKQRRFNAYAQYYEAAEKAAVEGQYTDLPKQSQFVRTPPYGLGDVFVNPIESLVGLDPLPTWELYAGRVMETDARLRLASLQAWLRRTPPEQDLMTRIAKAGQGVYDPFTGFPMLVNKQKGVLYSVGQDLKDNEALSRLDVVAKIPSVAWPDGTRPDDSEKSK